MAEIRIRIEGMSCGGCARNVTRALEALPGVDTALVSLENATATIQYDPAHINADAIIRAVEATGFDVPQ
ncbi:MAG: heavy-metal-associated domain-containing protein [Azoarcus sp.]|nr:heavy-metal-associated domain-containing protein [Azoarcus sp.]